MSAGRECEILKLTIFIGVDYDTNINDSSFIRSSTGIALEYFSPIGPLSFSLTQPITKKSSDKTESFRFNLGTTF